MILKYQLFENIIEIPGCIEYLTQFFTTHQSEILNFTTDLEFQNLLDQIIFPLSEKYCFYIDDQSEDDIKVEILPRKNNNLIMIELDLKQFINRCKVNFQVEITDLCIKIKHEMIHIEQFIRGNYFHPVSYNGKYFKNLKQEIKQSLTNKEYTINNYISNNYEIMTVANTLYEILLSKYDKKEIENILKGISTNKIDFIDCIKDRKIKNKIYKYMYMYLKKQ